MTLPEGFQATLFAGEPDVVQPIAMTFDDRGRLWVVECLSYPKWSDKPEGTDRVLMFEDTDGDGKFDKRTVIFDKGANLSGIELGFGGIWLCSIPNLLFIPCDFNADAPKIGKPEAVLDGWSLKCKHNVFNSLTWGPDGWLYGCNGIIDTSYVGKPDAQINREQPGVIVLNVDANGAVVERGKVNKEAKVDSPDRIAKFMKDLYEVHKKDKGEEGVKEIAIVIHADKQANFEHVYRAMRSAKDAGFIGVQLRANKDRIAMNCGVWRYHPTKKIFEPFAHGTTNPFGLDFDDYGECFITNCVISHIWHVIPGAHFERMYGEDLNKNTYQLMKSCADHLHWGGGPWTSSRGGKGVHSEAGGGHAHVGCMIYLGDNWPDKYRNGAFMLNLHGSRVNHDRLERQGSGYVAKHEKDFLLANDPWFRGIAIKYGPDGGVYMSDWTDTGECHNYEKVDLTNGRIYKVTYGKVKQWKGDISKLSDAELVKLHEHKNDWHVRHARRVLQERAAAGKLDKKTAGELRSIFFDNNDERRRLRALWTLHCLGALNGNQLLRWVDDRSEAVACWSLRLFFDMFNGEGLAEEIELPHLKSPRLQLALASGLSRTDLQRDNLAYLLLNSAKPTDDQPFNCMIWYALEKQIASNPEFGVASLESIQLPHVRQLSARRIAGLPAWGDAKKNGLQRLTEWLGQNKRASDEADVLRGMLTALQGQRSVQAPQGWEDAYTKLVKSPNADVRATSMRLAVILGDKQAIASLIKTVRDRAVAGETRQSALQALVQKNNPEIVPLLEELLGDTDLRGNSIRALAAFNRPDVPQLFFKHYDKFTAAEKADAVQTLASRSAWALKLLDAIEAKQIPRSDVSVFTARQIQGLKDKQVQERLAKVWGQIKPASAEKVAQTAKFKKLLTPEFLKAADHSKGRAVYAKNCAACHRLYDDGGDIGPALTGAQRHNLDYVLENVLDPSAVVAKEYQMVKIDTLSGRTINGIVKQETEKAITIQTPNEVIVLPKDEIESRKQSPLSMMPEGLFDKLSSEEIRDLVAYLAGKDQVPLPKEK